MRGFRFCIPFFLLLATRLLGQHTFAVFPEKDSTHYTAAISTHFEENANSIPNSMQRVLLWGGFMDRDFLTGVREELKPRGNRFGFEFATAVQFGWKKENKKWLVGAKYRDILGLNFSKDLWGVAFLGNAAYEGQEADFSKTKLTYWQYTGLTFGLLKEIKEGWTSYLGMGFYYGLNYQTINTRTSTLFTAVDGEYLTLKSNMQLTYKQPGYGLGWGVSGYISKTWGKNSFLLGIEDLGAMQFQKTESFDADASTQYKGVYIESISDFTGDSLFSDFSSKGFGKRFGLKEKQGPKTVFLPFYASVRYQRQLTEKWKASAEVYYTYVAAYIPRITARGYYHWGRDWETSLGVAYGGFGKQNLLLGVSKVFARHWAFQMEGYFLGMAFLPDNSNGIGLNVGIRKSY